MIVRVRSPLEIQKAHDLLSALMDLPDLFQALAPSETDRDCMAASLSALCWVLHHGEGAFERNIRLLESHLRRLGLAMQDEEPGGGAKAETTH